MYELTVNQPRGWITVTGEGLPWPIALRVAFDEFGRVIVTGLRVAPDQPAEITRAALRDLPLGKITREVQRALSGDPMERFVMKAVFEATSKHRRSPLGRSHFEEVAAQVRQQPDRLPIEVLRERWPDTTDATRYRWLQRATDMGLLGDEDRPVEIAALRRDLEQSVAEARAARRAGGGQAVNDGPTVGRTAGEKGDSR
jgi:hypothetical protein